MSTKAPSCADAEGHVSANQNFGQHRQQQQLGKQVRRRLTNRPYQERLMNMAEARKEIATALKYHRATTKLATEHQRQLQHHHQQHQSLFFQLPFYSRFSPDGRFKARRRPMIFLLDNNNTLDPTLLFDNNILDDTHVLNNNILDGTPVLNNNILDGTPVFNYNNNLEPIPLSSNNVSSLCSYSTPTLTSPPFLTQQDVPLIRISQSQGEMVSTTMNIIESSTTNQASGSMHVSMDEEGMKEIRALGQQHQMEWDDTTSMITSARWYDYLQQMENSATAVNNGDDTCHGIFDDQLEFPIWKN
ncbi:uncharacterized protein LOC124845566 [Vigna umbellata]|uniref:uncharacterized protein LOC124845566 n=1 Tax=Vigna umbellata TaxID=87088 RepID=UPI001F5F41E5|nr:uncharacterized protein LOC124845566 [Vigna umbellata]